MPEWLIVALAIGVFLLLMVGSLLLAMSYSNGTPPYGTPRRNIIRYAHGGITHPVTDREAYGLWHVFAEGPDRAVVWMTLTGRTLKQRD